MQIKFNSDDMQALFSALAPTLQTLIASLTTAGKKASRPRRSSGPAQYERLPHMKWTQGCYQLAMEQIGSRPPELGGILLGPVGEQLASHFLLDQTGSGTSTSWTFGHSRINEILRQYVPLGLDMKGFLHSHPNGVSSLSPQDVNDFRKPFANPKNDVFEVWAPIIVNKQVYPFLLLRDQPQPVLAQLVLL